MDLAKRKQNRLENYDYSQGGAYFITICVKDRKKVLCDIVGDDESRTVVLGPSTALTVHWTVIHFRVARYANPHRPETIRQNCGEIY